MKDKRFIRQKSAEFVKAMVKKAQTKEDPANPDFGEKDQEKIKKITQELKDQYSAKKGIRTTRGN